MKLSKNFSLSEFTKSATAAREGIDNTPNGEHLENLRYVVETVAQPLRTAFGKPVTVNSGYRSKALNEAVGGSSRSQHCNGEAVDLEINGVANKAVADWITANCEFDQIILEFYNPEEGENSGWVHVSAKQDGNNRRQKLIAFKDGKTTRYVEVDDFDPDDNYEQYL